MHPLKLLLLGGTTEASALARLLADDARFLPTLSLAGRTRSPVLQPVRSRIGGFGGVSGLAAYLSDERIDAVIDATHPFATRITANAIAACAAVATPLLRVERPAWTPEPGDDWRAFATLDAAAAALGIAPRTVLLTIGRHELAPFRAASQHHYVIRSVDAPAPADCPPRATIITARGPFSLDGERSLLRAHAIACLVTKNAGGEATRAKLVAAREHRVPVMMVSRPDTERACATVATVAQARDWLTATHAALRGV